MGTALTQQKPVRLFVILGAVFVASAMIAEVIGVKIFSLEDSMGIPRANLSIFGSKFSFHLTAGVLLWPIVFIMTDIINEYYGPKAVRFLSLITVALISYSFVIYQAAIHLSPSEYFSIGHGIEKPDDAFGAIFGQGLWIIIGSIIAFLIGQLLDVFVFHRIKKITGENAIWLRATGSTLISQLIDSFVVLFIAFYVGKRIQPGQGDPWTLHQVLVTGTGNYIYKFIVALILIPVIYFIHGWIEKYIGLNDAKRMKDSAMQNDI